MFNQHLREEFPFATNFFESALKQAESKFFHSFLLVGSNVCAQYEIALEAARYLNCENKADFENCNCLNCRWIKENKHPAIITISPVDYLEGHSDGKAKSVISVDQIRHLKNSLALSSPYHRVIILTGAKEEQLEKSYDFNPPALANQSEKRLWSPYGLSSNIFKAPPSNAILKSIEEPNPQTTFFFLCSNKEDILPTITSRSQCINVVSNKIQHLDTAAVASVLQKFPPKKEQDAIVMAQEILDLSKNRSIEQLLDMMQEHFKSVLENNFENRANTFKITSIINKIHNAKVQSMSYVSAQGLLENLFLELM
jgi:DNA polymerase-3 subunit delta'